MEKQLIEQLLSNGLSIKKFKDIVEHLDIEPQNEKLHNTTIANTCGLRIIRCQGCHKTQYEDKFMLNKLNKRYRSCIACVMRQRAYRQKQLQFNGTASNVNLPTNRSIELNNNEVSTPSGDLIELNNNEISTSSDDLIILDNNSIERNDNNNNNNNDNDNDNNNNNIYPFPYPIEKDIMVKPINDNPKIKAKKKINNNNNYSILEPEIEPEELKSILFNLFN